MRRNTVGKALLTNIASHSVSYLSSLYLLTGAPSPQDTTPVYHVLAGCAYSRMRHMMQPYGDVPLKQWNLQRTWGRSRPLAGRRLLAW